MLKKDARKLYREKRALLTIPEKTKLDDLLLIRLQTASLPFIQTLLSYWPLADNQEPDTHLFSDFIAFRNPEMTVCYPRSEFGTCTMEAVATGEETRFVKNVYHIYEPAEGTILPPDEIDMIFVPLLAFDKQGYRAGYGKGFYDKFLAHCRPDCCKVGFSYFEPVGTLDDRHEFDVPLDLCITPQDVYVF